MYKYIKSPVKIKSIEEQDIVVLKRNDIKKLTLWEIISVLVKWFNRLLIRSKVAGFFIPFSLIIIGFVIIYKQVWPEIEQKLKYISGYYNTESVALVEGDYINRVQYLSDPGSEYFKELSSSARAAHVIEPDPLSNNYTGTFSLSIPSIGLYDLKVTANTDSGVEKVYDAILNSGLAHFKGTGLPISDVKNNIVIYGHSASGDYYERTKDVVAAFSRLEKVRIGDEVEIKMEGKMYKYRIIRSKIVLPNDVSILTGTPGQKTLTLFTCFPSGNRSQRFVAIAKPI